MSADSPQESETSEPSPEPAPEVTAVATSPQQSRWRRIWQSLHSRFARQIALTAVALGAIAATGHFIGGMIGWWHAYEVTFGGHKAEEQVPAKALRANAPPLSLVVLPLSTDGERKDEWFADALLGDLTTEIARLPDSFVIARDTAHTYKGKAVDPREVARELAVRYVVTGRLRHDGELIRLDFALVDGESGAQRWAEKFVVDRSRLNSALDEFVLQLSRHLSIEVTRSAGSRVAALSPSEVTADDLSMRAFSLWYRGVNRENLTEALSLLERAVAMDSNSVRGWGAIAFMNLQGVTNGWIADRAAAFKRMDEARVNLERLDPEGFFTYQARVIDVFLKRDSPAMLRLTQEWTERYRHPTAFGAHGMALILNGRPDDGVPQLELALRLSPRDAFRAEWQYRLAFAHFIAGRYDKARDWGQTAQVSNPALTWPPVHAAALVRLGHTAEAKKVFDEFQAHNPKYDAGQIERRLAGTDPLFVAGRERLTASLRELGLR